MPNAGEEPGVLDAHQEDGGQRQHGKSDPDDQERVAQAVGEIATKKIRWRRYRCSDRHHQTGDLERVALFDDHKCGQPKLESPRYRKPHILNPSNQPHGRVAKKSHQISQ